MVVELASKTCRPCKGDEPPLADEEVSALLVQLDGWILAENAIQKEFRFRDFRQSMDFVNLVAAIAEAEGHHPDITISWNHVTLSLTTHAIHGLSENDFILAAKIDQIQR
jgi:4a-hydroxytetrahydrobiopterin dehydratase